MTTKWDQIQETSAMNAFNFIIRHKEGRKQGINREQASNKAALCVEKMRIERVCHKKANDVYKAKTGWMSRELLEFCQSKEGTSCSQWTHTRQIQTPL